MTDVEQCDAQRYGEVEELSEVIEQRDEKQTQKTVHYHEDDKLLLQQAKYDFVNKVASTRVGCAKLGPVLNSEGKKYTRALPKGEISHASAKMIAPPTAYAWINNIEGPWCGKQPPHGEISRSWVKYGEQQALKLVLRSLWESFLISKGASLKDCLIAGIF